MQERSYKGFHLNDFIFFEFLNDDKDDVVDDKDDVDDDDDDGDGEYDGDDSDNFVVCFIATL